MDKQEKITLELYSKEFMDSLFLSSVAEGRFWLYRTTANGQQKFLEIVSRDDVWCFLIPTTLKVKGEPNACFKIKGNHMYEITDDKQQILLLISRVYNEDKYKFKMIHTKDDSMNIGRSFENEIQYDDPLISLQHAILERHNERWYICDMGSTNGVYVNKKRIVKAYLNIGDVIDLYGLIIITTSTGILVNTIQHATVHIKSQKYVIEERDIPYEKIHMQFIHIAPYRCLSCYENVIEIEGPPKITLKDEMPMIYMLGPSITMGLSSISMAVYSLYNTLLNKQNIAQVIPTILMAISMSLGTILWPILSKKYERKQKKKQETHRIKKYTHYLRGIQNDIHDVIKQQQTLLCTTYPIAYASESCSIESLWSRKYCDDSFLVCVLGTGNVKANLTFTYPKENFQLHEDELYMKMQAIVQQDYVLSSVPVILNLKARQRVGMIGENCICEELMIQLIHQIAWFHSYQDVKIICLAEPSFLRKYHIPYLPHMFSEDKSIRYMIYDQKDVKRLRQHFEERKNMEYDMKTPCYIMFCFLKDHHTGGLFIQDFENMEHFSILHHARKKADLPAYCEEILLVDEKHQSVYFESGQIAHLHLQLDRNMANDFLYLANLRVAEEQVINFPDELSFLDLFECGNIQQLHIVRRWQKADVVHSLETAIGIHETGEVLFLDAHENYHGPHGLLAGMTGSGKSETILTYILSLAINYSPTDISFLLIDYKGGSMAKAFEKLPHVAGIITNLDQGSMQRCLAAIQSEVTRRQKIFAKVSKIYDKSNIDIDKYRSLCQEHKELEVVSHLFIIADEFAELKSLQPQFLDCLKQSARIGRSLGIHLLLATQKPSGVVDDQIWSNSRFHICLRVQDRSDSQDMLKREDAAFIRRTGLFYFQVGNNEEFKKGLSAWSQAPYEPQEFYEKHNNDAITCIDQTGLVIRSRECNHKDTNIKETQLDAIVTYIAEVASRQRIKAEPIWKEELPENLCMKEVKQQYGEHIGLIGCVDDVYHQAQFPMCITIDKFQHMVIYGQTHSGKYLFLETLLTSWIIDYDAAQVSIVILNCEDMKFQIFQTAGIIADVLFTEDKEKVESMFVQIMLEIKRRKNMLSNKYHSIVIIIHNFERFHELYEENDSDLLYILREGEKYRVFILLTLNNVNNLPYKFSQYIQKIIMFQVKEQSDYRLCYEHHNGLCPIQKRGSGIYAEKEVYLFQTGCYDASEIQNIMESRQGVNAFKIPILPKRVIYSIHDSEERVFIGLDVKSKEMVYLNLEYRYIYILGDYTLFWTYVELMLHLVEGMHTVLVLKCVEQVCDKDILEALDCRAKQGKKVIVVWYRIQTVSLSLTPDLFTQIMKDEQITHIILDTMNEVTTYTMFDWFASSLVDASILWMGNGFIDHQYFLKRVSNNLQNRLQRNRAYLWEEDQCREIQLWEEEKNG